ncbi:MAG: F0F1 ATP synthase subunit delta [bacterium]
MIHGASRQSLAVLREYLAALLSARAASPAEEDRRLADELDAVSRLLAAQPRLRRILADPATDNSLRGDLLRRLLANKIGPQTLDLVADAARQRWSTPWDLADAIQSLSDDVLLATAEQQGRLDAVEDELFRFERILADNDALSAALDDRAAPADRRVGLLRAVLGDKVEPITSELLVHAMNSGRKHLALAIDDLLEASAVRRSRSVARVVSASELTPEQNQRLSTALTRLYGRDITVRTAVEPDVRGGLEVRVGNEVIDATVATRLAAARAAVAGRT